MNSKALLPFLLLLLVLSSTELLAQSNPLLSKSGHEHDHDHKSCGFDGVMEGMIDIDPSFRQKLLDYHNSIPQVLEMQSDDQKRGPNTLYIPVVVHVIHNGEAVGSGQNIPVEQIEAQLETLNEDFSAQNDGFANTPARWAGVIGNPDIQFCLASLDENGNPTTGITRHNLRVTGTSYQNNNIRTDIQPQTIWDPKKYFNMWTLAIPGTTAGGGVTGWATLPTRGVSNGTSDGTVVDYRFFGPGQGTLTHEGGHYLGLPHTFANRSCSGDDGFTDTPNMGNDTNATTRFSCRNGYPTGPSTCGEEHMYVNYMDYAPSSCETSFTMQQITMMRNILQGNVTASQEDRSSLVNNALTSCTFFDHDASLTEVYEPTSLLCADLPNIIPSVKLLNLGFLPMNSVQIYYSINSGPAVQTNWITNLQPGESEIVPLIEFATPVAGEYNIEFYTEMPNGMVDENMENDRIFSSFTTLDKEPFTTVYEDFSAGFNDPDPLANLGSGLSVYNPTNDFFEWEWYFASTPIPSILGSARFNNYVEPQHPSGRINQVDMLLTKNFDLTGVTGTTISFDVSYAQYTWSNGDSIRTDSLLVLVSTDCGASFSNIEFSKGGSELATEPPTNARYLPLSTSTWRNEIVDLSAYDGMENVIIAVTNASGQGNYLYVDNINISSDQACFLEAFPAFSVVDCHDDCDGEVSIVVRSGTPPYTYQWPASANNQMTETGVDLCPGGYEVTVTDADNCSRIINAQVANPDDLTLEIDTIINATCGQSDGAIDVTPAGGSQSLSVFWLPPVNRGGSSISGLAAGTYTARVRDVAKGCLKDFDVTVTDASDTELEISAMAVTCASSSDGTASVIASGTGTPFTYLWDDPLTQSNPTATGLSTGTYSVTVTDVNGCSAIESVEVTGPDDILLMVSTTASSCAGGTSASATVTASGGTVSGDYLYVWSDPLGQTTATATGLAGGTTYTVTVTDDNGCSKTIDAVVPDGVGITLTTSKTDVDCFGENTGTATVTGTGGTISGDYNYSWDDPSTQSTSTATGLVAGTYGVTVTDDNGCTSTASVVVEEADELFVTASSTDPACAGEATGTASVVASGGTPPFDYLWDDGPESETDVINSLIQGTYNVTVTDDKGCTTTALVTLSDPEAILITVNDVVDVGCNGAATGSISITATGGTASNDYDYLWDDPLAQTTATATGLVAGTYTLTVTDDNDCTQTITRDVNEPDMLSLTIVGSQDITCFGEADGSITALASGGTGPYDYLWDDPLTQNTATATGLGAGTYNVQVIDANGCPTSISFELQAPDEVILTTSSTDITAVGADDGTATAMVSGGSGSYTYVWSNTETTSMIDDLAPGTYCVTVTDSEGCSKEECVTVNGVNCPTIEITIAGDDVSCFGGDDGAATATATGGSTPYTYVWDDPLAQSDATATGLSAGIYQVTATDANGCQAVNEVEIEEPNELTVVVTKTDETSAGLMDGTATATPSGGTAPYSYAWDPTGSTQTITGLSPGTYSVTVTDENGCTAEGSVVVNAGNIDCTTLAVTLSMTPVSCFGGDDGTATATATGGDGNYTYSWDDPSGQSSMTATGLTVGSIVVTVSDGNGCQVIENIMVTQPDELVGTIAKTDETSAGLSDGTATASASGGTSPYSYDWGPNGTGPMITGLAPGTYNVTITDENGCTTTESVVINPGGIDCSTLEIVSITGTPVSCFGGDDGTATVTVTGGDGDYGYLWEGGSLTATATGLVSATYMVTVRDGNGCEVVGSVEIEQPDELVISATSTDETGNNTNDGTATASSTGGTPPYTYEWSNLANTASISNLAPGTYSVTVVDDNGCRDSTEVVVNPGLVDCSTLEVEIEGTNPDCNGGRGSALALATGGDGNYHYLWSTTDTTQGVNGLAAGTYFLTVTDDSGCEVNASVEITEPDALSVSISKTDETSAGLNDGTATATVSGGTPPYTYEWSNLANTPSISNLAPGTYEVTVTDDNGCAETASVIILAGDMDCSTFEIEMISEDVTCNGLEDGFASVNVLNGVFPFTYLWEDASTNGTRIDLAPDTYEVTVTDANGCTLEGSVTINEPDVLMANLTFTDETVAGANDGTATASPSGGTSPYSYAWALPATTPIINNLAPGIYEVTITDANGCSVTDEVEITGGPVDCSDLMVEIIKMDVSCFGEEDGTAQLNITGGERPYSIDWDKGDDINPRTDLGAETYSVTITDSRGCELTEIITVEEPDQLMVMVEITDETVLGLNDGSAKATVIGGASPFVYDWGPGLPTTSEITMLVPGDYEVTVTDANGCTAVGVGVVALGSPDCTALNVEIETTDVSCADSRDGTATITVTGEQGDIEVFWSSGGSGTSVSNYAKGMYTVRVEDNVGCEVEVVFTIGGPEEIVLNVTGNDGKCGSRASALANVSGGTAPFTYEWSNGLTDRLIRRLDAGLYRVTITDANGCTSEGAVNVAVDPGGLQVAADKQDVSCFGDADGSIDIEILSGKAPFDIQWSNGESVEDLNGLSPGTYNLIIMDDDGCSYITSIEINEPQEIDIDFDRIPLTSPTASNGSATANVKGGTTPYTYDWSNGSDNRRIDDLRAGTYFLTVTDGNGCIHVDSVVIDDTQITSTYDLDALLSFDVFPNPASNQVNVMAEFAERIDYQLGVYNIVGQQVYLSESTGQDIQTQIAIDHLPAGTYLIRIYSNKGQAVRKLVVNRR